ncbi:hypothetical protein BDL97_13G008000 [Sphagnum fallax]|nr:hypothetical protein BDL97_13G008000 [Sphagnum fallax]
MGSTNPIKRHARQWKLLDCVSIAMMCAIFVLFMLVFTSLGDSLAASGQRYLDQADQADAASPDFWEEVEKGLTVVGCALHYTDHMPCHDAKRAKSFAKERNHYRERHCPPREEKLRCLIPPPIDYRIPIPWPKSLHKIYFNNTPHGNIAELKADQGWMNQAGDYFEFPGGGTMFPEGAEHYVQNLGKYIPIGRSQIRTALDIGCGVASFGAYLLKKDILTMSMAPRDSHKAQIQFALERGIPAFVGILGTQRLQFPSFAFDLIHCSRCLVPFSAYNGSYFIEVDRILRPGGYFVLSGPPVNWPGKQREYEILQELITKKLCHTLVSITENTGIWQKPTNASCYIARQEQTPPICEDEDPNKAWYTPLDECITQLPQAKVDTSEAESLDWQKRLETVPKRLAEMLPGEDILFASDMRRWHHRLQYYKQTLGIAIGSQRYRNVMDMNAVYGGFAANIAAANDPVWVMNVVPAFGPNTLHAIYDRGLLGVVHDWCEAFSTYPRTYDLIHAATMQSFTTLQKRCSLAEVMIEMDRILRPEGTVIIRDSPGMIAHVVKVAKAIGWSFEISESEPGAPGKEQIFVARKEFWKVDNIATQ